MDDLERLRHRRLFPGELDALGQQTLLNLALSGKLGSVEIFVKLADDAEPVDYVQTIIEKRWDINKAFDELMIKLGYPEGTGQIV